MERAEAMSQAPEGYRLNELADRLRISRATLDRECRRRGVRRTKIGNAVVLHAGDVEKAFSFGGSQERVVAPGEEMLDRARRLLQ